MDFPFRKDIVALLKSPKVLLPLFSLAVLTALLTTVHVKYYYPLFQGFSRLPQSSYSSSSAALPPSVHHEENDSAAAKKCDIFLGEWVPNPDAPYYTNTTCYAISDQQNCIKYGRPDLGFLKWRWKPYDCQLPIFDPIEFLQLLRGKTMAFVGDSLSRNHLQSLICLLSKVEYPVEAPNTAEDEFKRWEYKSHNFTLAYFWSTFLIRSEESDPDGPSHNGVFNLYLDEPDRRWTQHVAAFDYIMVSGFHWFSRSTMFYERRRLVGCHYCLRPSVPDRGAIYGYRRALRTALAAINSSKNFTGVAMFRTFTPAHFEEGEWNSGGDCLRKAPFRSDEAGLKGSDVDVYMVQMEEFRVAERRGKKRVRLLDTTRAMSLRGDGHPGRYGQWPGEENATKDCLHWCMPGPVDTWSDMMLQIMKMEE